MSGPADVQKIRDACARSPNLTNILVGRKLLLQLCKDVERYRVENDDLQRHAERLSEMLEDQIETKTH